MSKGRIARDIVIDVIDNLCVIDNAPNDITDKTIELYEAAADYLIRDFEAENISLEDLKDELGLDYEDDEDLD